MGEKNKRGKGLIIIIVILIIVILGLVCYICYDKGFIFARDEKINQKEKTEDEEVAIDIKEIKKDLSMKVNYLTFGYSNSSALDTEDYNKYSFRNSKSEFGFGNVFGEIDDEFKLMVALNSLEGQYKPLSYSMDNMNISDSYKSEDMSAVFTQIEASIVNDRYRDLFGKDISAYNNIDRCPSYLYDSVNRMYFRVAECGGTSAARVSVYKNKYTSRSDYAYVYVNFAISDIDENEIINIYKDLDGGIYKANVTSEEASKFKLDSNNYESFCEYKYVFKKGENGNYYFVSLEKIR